MKDASLRLAAELGGTRLSGDGGPILLIERVRAHGLPSLAVLGRAPSHFREALAAWEGGDAALNLALLIALPETDVTRAFAAHRRRIGAVSAALDASLPWLADRPMLAKRLPGLAEEGPPGPAFLGPLEAAELHAFLPDWDAARFDATFRSPESLLWPEAARPTRVKVEPLRLAVGSPLLDALRDALRRAFGHPIPLLPLPEDPSGLHALRVLSPEIAAFRGPMEAWDRALHALARLPAPPHFCARC
ncbi:MAG: hypothetical protein JST24_10015 [Acidobacteria bacterium]|nr:hypothetical protein [Acidobacteriota bacterium]